MSSELRYSHFRTQREAFFHIAETRPHRSYLTGDPIGPDLQSWNFAHVLPKRRNAYPGFKTYVKNIVLLSKDEHDIWDTRRHAINLDDKPKWKKLIELERELKIEYRKIFRGIKS